MLNTCYLALSALVALLFALGCQKTPEQAADRFYDLKGKVVAVAADKKSVTLDHEAIPGFMKAMQMPFAVDRPEILEGIEVGDAVEGKLKVTPDKRMIVSELKHARRESPAAK